MKKEEKIISGVLIAGVLASVYLVATSVCDDEKCEKIAGKKMKKFAENAGEEFKKNKEKVEEEVADTAEKGKSFVDEILDKLADYAVSNRDQLAETVKTFLKK